MIFSEKSRYDRIFHKVTHKGGEPEMNYIKRFQYSKDLSVSAGNSYYEDQLMHIFLDNFHQGGKYTAQISSHQEELRSEEKFTDQKSLSITSLQTDCLNLDQETLEDTYRRYPPRIVHLSLQLALGVLRLPCCPSMP